MLWGSVSPQARLLTHKSRGDPYVYNLPFLSDTCLLRSENQRSSPRVQREL